MSKLKVTFDDPEHGWIMLTLTHEAQRVELVVSHIYDSLSQLVLVLHQLSEEQGQVTITWLAEPVEYDILFIRHGDSLSLEVKEFADWHRNNELSRPLFHSSGNYTELCIPFWRALRSLQGRFTADDLERRWKNFPSSQLDKLTVAIEQAKAA